MRRLAVALVTSAALTGAPAAHAQGPVYQAVDDPAGTHHRWQPDKDATVEVQVGDTVTWRYDGTTLAHNVKSASTNWNVDTPASTSDPTPVTYTFAAEGTYYFVCKFHADTMKGQVKVGNPPPPPPPPLSEQPFPNDQQPPTQRGRQRREAPAAQPRARDRGRQRRSRALPSVRACTRHRALQARGHHRQVAATDIPRRRARA